MPFPRNHGNCKSDDVTRGSPSRERGKKDNETTQKRGRCWKYAISVQDAGGDDGGGKASVIWDTMSCRVKVRGIQTEEGKGMQMGWSTEWGRRHGSKYKGVETSRVGVLSWWRATKRRGRDGG